MQTCESTWKYSRPTELKESKFGCKHFGKRTFKKLIGNTYYNTMHLFLNFCTQCGSSVRKPRGTRNKYLGEREEQGYRLLKHKHYITSSQSPIQRQGLTQAHELKHPMLINNSWWFKNTWFQILISFISLDLWFSYTNVRFRLYFMRKTICICSSWDSGWVCIDILCVHVWALSCQAFKHD